MFSAKNQKIKRKRRPRQKNYYFTRVHQDAIVKFVNSSDEDEKNKIYKEVIEPAISELVDKIAFTYKFTSLPNNEVLRSECKNWIITVLHKFDPTRGPTAFSYFTVVIKNWFIHKAKEVSKEKSIHICYEDYFTDESNENTFAVNGYEENREEEEFWLSFFQDFEYWEPDLQGNEKIVLDGVKKLLENIEQLEILHNKAIFMYLREITGLKTKEINATLPKLRELYVEFKKEWNQGKI